MLTVIRMRQALHARSIVLIAFLAALAAGAWGCGSEKPAPPADGAAAAQPDAELAVERYTNEDLERLPPTTELPPDDGSPGVVVATPAPQNTQPEQNRKSPRG